MKIIPISLKEAQEYVAKYHRHSIPPVGHKFSIGCQNDNGDLCGVAICGRPTARAYDNGRILYIARVCTDGTYNACSMLYGACCRVARSMGYEKVVTYTLESENGASLRASNFICEGRAGGKEWRGDRKRNYYVAPAEFKLRWVRLFL